MMLARGMAAPKLKRPPKKVSLPVETSVAWKPPPNFQVCSPRRCERLSLMSYSRWIVRDGRKMSRLKNPKPSILNSGPICFVGNDFEVVVTPLGLQFIDGVSTELMVLRNQDAAV